MLVCLCVYGGRSLFVGLCLFGGSVNGIFAFSFKKKKTTCSKRARRQRRVMPSVMADGARAYRRPWLKFLPPWAARSSHLNALHSPHAPTKKPNKERRPQKGTHRQTRDRPNLLLFYAFIFLVVLPCTYTRTHTLSPSP